MFFDNVSLSIQGQNLEGGTKGIEENSEEECRTS
jgi:hypothetical protein